MKPPTARIRRGLRDLAEAMRRERISLVEMRVLPLGRGLSPQEIPIPDGAEADWRPIAPGDYWGGQDENAWFHAVALIPAHWPALAQGAFARHAVCLRLTLGQVTDFGWPEGLLYLDGAILQGINQYHEDLLIPAGRLHTGAIAIDVRAWSGMASRDHRLEQAEITLIHRDAEALYHVLYAGCDLVDALDDNSPLVHPLMAALDDAYDALDMRRPSAPSLEQSAGHALEGLRASLAKLRARTDHAETRTVTAIGHGHLDVAWMWQTRHTREKAARTFSIATALMDLYPEYVYLHTTPQVYRWLEQDYPGVFAEVKRRVIEGRFEAAGAMWLESDTNIVSGESLVRQILYGQRYLRETFGLEYDHLWLPDTFGYTYSLPQLLLKSGLQSFMTTKMSWSDTNRIPHDTFRWRGLDGSETLAHFVTAPWQPSDTDLVAAFDNDTYNARFIVPAITRLWERYRDKDINRDLLLVYGHGDGGGGPTRQHLERYRAIRELPGLPTVRLGRADDYLHALRARVWGLDSLPTWDGELYLEYHRGVYTTQAWLKRLHRRNEERLLLAETLDATLWTLKRQRGEQANDNRPWLDDAWRTLLLHEFHDILPGSSISEVYADARVDLTALATRLDNFIVDAERNILDMSGAGDGASAWMLHNPSPCATPSGASIALLPLEEHAPPPALTIDGAKLATQEVADRERGRYAYVEAPPMPARGWIALQTEGEARGRTRSKAPQPAAPLTAEPTEDGGAVLTSALYRLEVNSRGEIASLLDQRVSPPRELIAAGRVGAQFIAFDDRPKEYDAWDIDAGYTRKPYLIDAATARITETGPVRATVRIIARFLDSVIEQDISLCRASPRIDFATHIQWRQQQIMLKVAFPLDLRATEARSEIQYGSITRPTHTNTSWDQARFETVAHRWIDLSEGDYGVALLNDGCYGHDIHGTVARLTLLRSPTSPDANADLGEHQVNYSLVPHLGAWPHGDVVAHGYALNRPLRMSPSVGAAPQPLVTVDNPAVIVEAVKRAAESDDLIVRLYESTGGRAFATVSVACAIADVRETDLLERPLEPGSSPAYEMWRDSPVASHDAPEVTASAWSCQLRPFEVRTFRITPNFSSLVKRE